jgi:hypothetical protein
MPSFGRYEQAAELVRRLRAESRPVAFDAGPSVTRREGPDSAGLPGAARPVADQ